MLCVWGSTDPESLSYDPALSRQPGIHFSAFPENHSSCPTRSFELAQLAMGCSNPPLFMAAFKLPSVTGTSPKLSFAAHTVLFFI